MRELLSRKDLLSTHNMVKAQELYLMRDKAMNWREWKMSRLRVRWVADRSS